jgi:multicomponent Na+:H+ antiporter subunit C
MSLTLVVLVGVLVAVAVYLFMHRTLTRIVLGVGMLGNAVNVLLFTTSGRTGAAPILRADGTTAEPVSDPLPQALVLTAIVIGFALIAFLCALAWRSWTLDGNDVVEDDVEDRRLARDAAASAPAPGTGADGGGRS